MRTLSCLLAFALLTLLAACTAVPVAPPTAGAMAAPLGPPERTIYTLQHRTIPQFVFQSNGAFVEDLLANRTDTLLRVIGERAGEAYRAGVRFTPAAHGRAMIISFPEPKGMTECYHVAVVKVAPGHFRYLTLEKTADFYGTGAKACLCEWIHDGQHKNYDGRGYVDAATFAAEVEQLLAVK